jgi:hypothetical protein
MSDSHEHTATQGGHESPATESWLSRHAPYILLLGFLYYATQITIRIFDEFFYFYRVLPLVENAIVALFVAAGIGVLIRVVVQAVRRASLTNTLRAILGEPTWWRTWYPRTLRVSGSVWDRLPPALKLMRTVIWLELLLLPAGFVLAIFVIPTFQAVWAALGLDAPLVEHIFMTAVTIGGYVLPVILVAVLVQARSWHNRFGLPLWVAFNAFFSVNRDFWRETEARQLLRG